MTDAVKSVNLLESIHEGVMAAMMEFDKQMGSDENA